MNMQYLKFKQTGETTDEQTQAIANALKRHGITVPGGGGYGCFDWLCERIKGALLSYISTKDWKQQSRADALADIERLHDAMCRMGGDATTIIRECALLTNTEKLFWHMGLEPLIVERYDSIMQNDKPEYGEVSNELAEWINDNHDHGVSLSSLAWSVLKESCELALSNTPPESYMPPDNGKDIVEANTANTKGGRPTDEAKQSLVQELAWEFEAVAKRRASDTPKGPFDDFLTACLAIVEPSKGAESGNRKLIRTALNMYQNLDEKTEV